MGQGNTQEIRHIQSKVLEPTCRQDEAAVSYQEGGEATPGNRGLTSSWLIGYQGKQGRSKSLIASWGRYFPAGWSHSGLRIKTITIWGGGEEEWVGAKYSGNSTWAL